jgi:hypothetical protein
MGQIINLDQWRREHAARSTVSSSTASGLHAPVTYVDNVMLPSITLWRAMMATWACWWLAPVGLEIRPIEARRPSQPQERASSSR